MKRYRRRKYRPSSRRATWGKKALSVGATLLACVLLILTGVVIARSGLMTPIEWGDPTESNSAPVSLGDILEQIDLVEPETSSEELEKIEPMPLEEVDCSYIVIDRTNGEVLLAKGQENMIYPGSATKIMTAALSMEQVSDLDTPMEVSNFIAYLIGNDASKIGLKAGEILSFRDLLYGLMVPSGCDAANVIAENVGGTYNQFIQMMNDRAKQIGCTGTYFVNPSGLFGYSHFSTVADLARMEAFARKNSIYREITATKQYSLPATNLHPAEGWNIMSNTNRLLGNASLLEGTLLEINGAKTGTTTMGGYSLVTSAVTENGTEILAVVAGIPYLNGDGRYLRDSYMLSVLKAGAEIANQKTGTSVISKGVQEEAMTLLGEYLPKSTRIYTKRGFFITEITENDMVLEQGETPIFYTADDFSVTTSYYSNLEELLSQSASAEKEIGYLEITASNGEHPIQRIPLYCSKIS